MPRSDVLSFRSARCALAPDRLGAAVLPKVAKKRFFEYFASLLVVGPKVASSPTKFDRWNYVKLPKVAGALWHVAPGARSVFGQERPLRVGVSLAGSEKLCARDTEQKAPLFSCDVEALPVAGSEAAQLLKSGIREGCLPQTEDGLRG